MLPKTCSISECDRGGRIVRGWCTIHYQRWRAHGDPTFSEWNRTVSELFWSHVNKSGDCWEWTGSIAPNGYGSFHENRKSLNAHRMSYRLHNGDIADGQIVMHSCDNRKCVNPKHLSLGSYSDNTADMLSKARERHGEGHPLSKLTVSGVKRIRERRALGDTVTSLADEYGVSIATISRAYRGICWKRVPLSTERKGES